MAHDRESHGHRSSPRTYLGLPGEPQWPRPGVPNRQPDHSVVLTGPWLDRTDACKFSGRKRHRFEKAIS